MHIHHLSLAQSDLTCGDMNNIRDKQLNDRQINLLEPTVDRILDRLILHTDIYREAEEYGPRCICLDICAGESIFKTRDLFTDIILTDSLLVVRGVNVDSKPMTVKHEGR